MHLDIIIILQLEMYGIYRTYVVFCIPCGSSRCAFFFLLSRGVCSRCACIYLLFARFAAKNPTGSLEEKTDMFFFFYDYCSIGYTK